MKSKTGLTGKKAENLLDKVNITCNKNTVPYDIGKNRLLRWYSTWYTSDDDTRFNEEDFRLVARLIDQALMNPTDEALLETVKASVKTLNGSLPTSLLYEKSIGLC